jgi:hypothetical protein
MRERERFGWLVWLLLFAHRHRNILGAASQWSHYTDTSKPVDGNGAQNMVTGQSGFEPAIFRSLAHELTNCSNRARRERERESDIKSERDTCINFAYLKLYNHAQLSRLVLITLTLSAPRAARKGWVGGIQIHIFFFFASIVNLLMSLQTALQ